MGDLVAFLWERLDEDESAAREAAGLTECWVAEEPAIGVVLVDGEPLIEGHITGLTAHIARHDPARVLREVEAKRKILELHKPDRNPDDQWYGHDVRCEECGGIGGSLHTGERGFRRSWPCRTLRLHAAVYSDHPDYAGALAEQP